MSFPDSLYGSGGAWWSGLDALRLSRCRLGNLPRQVHGGPLCSPQRSSLSAAIDSHVCRLEFPSGFSGLLAGCFPGVHSELGGGKNPPSETLTRSEALRVVVLGHRALRSRLLELGSASTPEWRGPSDGGEWLLQNRDRPGFWAVENLAARIGPHLRKPFSGFPIHGTVASREAIPGFSDLDTMAVLSDETPSSEAELDRALRFLASTHICLLPFHPYMHHSHMLAVETEMEAMCIATTPPCLFRNGAYWGEWPAQSGVAQSDLECLLAFRPFDWFFEDWLRGRRGLRDGGESRWP